MFAHVTRGVQSRHREEMDHAPHASDAYKAYANSSYSYLAHASGRKLSWTQRYTVLIDAVLKIIFYFYLSTWVHQFPIPQMQIHPTREGNFTWSVDVLFERKTQTPR